MAIPSRRKGGGSDSRPQIRPSLSRGLVVPQRLLSIQRDSNCRSRKHSSGTARRLIRASRSAKATCLEDGSWSSAETGFSLACASIQELKAEDLERLLTERRAADAAATEKKRLEDEAQLKAETEAEAEHLKAYISAG